MDMDNTPLRGPWNLQYCTRAPAADVPTPRIMWDATNCGIAKAGEGRENESTAPPNIGEIMARLHDRICAGGQGSSRSLAGDVASVRGFLLPISMANTDAFCTNYQKGRLGPSHDYLQSTEFG